MWKTLCVIFWSAESHAYSPLVYLLPTPTVREDRNVVVVIDGLPEDYTNNTVYLAYLKFLDNFIYSYCFAILFHVDGKWSNVRPQQHFIQVYDTCKLV